MVTQEDTRSIVYRCMVTQEDTRSSVYRYMVTQEDTYRCTPPASAGTTCSCVGDSLHNVSAVSCLY